MTAAAMAELSARVRDAGTAKTLRCIRMGPPVDNDDILPDSLVRDGLVPLLSGPRRLEVRPHLTAHVLSMRTRLL